MLLLAACAQPLVQPAETKTEEKIIEKVIVQCWDGSTASSLEACPAKPKEEKIMAKDLVEPAPKAPETVPIGRQLLTHAQSYSGYAYELEDRMVLVSKDKMRHVLSGVTFVDLKPVTDVYVNLVNKTAVAYCDVEHEAQILGKAFTRAKSNCKAFIDKVMPVPFENWVIKGPLDYLSDVADLEPSFVEESLQSITIFGAPKTVQPSLHYVVDGRRIVLRIDQRRKAPIQVEIKGQLPISFRDVFFETMPLYGKQKNITDLLDYTPVSQEWLKQVMP